jgi:hypothetical protein
MATWNTSLDSPLLASNNVKRQSNLLETQMATGIVRRQRVSTLKRSTGTVSFIWDATQKAAWETYFSETLQDGVLAVSDFPYPLVAASSAQYVYFSADSETVLVPSSGAGLWRVTIPFSAEGRTV